MWSRPGWFELVIIGHHDRYLGFTLHWRHNDYDGVSNHQPRGCLLKRLFRRRSKKTSKLRVTGLCVGNSPGPVNSPHKGPVARKMLPFDDVIMSNSHQAHFKQHRNSLQWRHNELYGVSNHRRLDCLLNRLFGHRPKKMSKLCVTGLREGNPTRKMFHLMTSSC